MYPDEVSRQRENREREREREKRGPSGLRVPCQWITKPFAETSIRLCPPFTPNSKTLLGIHLRSFSVSATLNWETAGTERDADPPSSRHVQDPADEGPSSTTLTNRRGSLEPINLRDLRDVLSALIQSKFIEIANLKAKEIWEKVIKM